MVKAYLGGIIVWVSIWASYGKGLGAKNLAQIPSFGAACLTVVRMEPLADIGIMVLAKWGCRMKDLVAVDNRLYSAA